MKLEKRSSGSDVTPDLPEEKGQTLQALNLLYELQQEFSARDYEACEKTIAALESDGLKDTLSQEAREGLTSPAQRYQQLKDAVEHR